MKNVEKCKENIDQILDKFVKMVYFLKYILKVAFVLIFLQIQAADVKYLIIKNMEVVKWYIFKNRKQQINLDIHVINQGKKNVIKINLKKFVNLQDIKLKIDIAHTDINNIVIIKEIQHNIQHM